MLYLDLECVVKLCTKNLKFHCVKKCNTFG